MKVILAKSAGFCWGVTRAVEKARDAASTRTPIYTYGPLMHNMQMMQQLEKEGVKETGNPESLSSGTLLIRAHGIPPERRKELKQLPLTIVDATCPDVARIQGLIKKHVNGGYHIVIFGDKGHAEVDGLLGHAAGHGSVVSSLDDVSTLPELDRICLVSQSTQFPDDYAAISEAIKARCGDVLVLDTICNSTKSRQKELLDIIQKVDVLVVVGGAHSANTLRLVTLATPHIRTIHIQTADQINPLEFVQVHTAGVTAGASTPEFVIRRVVERLESLEDHGAKD